MALLNFILIVGIAIVPFAENAPSNLKSTEKDFKSRIVFEDDANEAPENFQISTFKLLPTPACNTQNFDVKTREPSVLTRMDDERQIWGIAVEDAKIEEDESFYNRPLALPKVIPKIPIPKRRLIQQFKVETPVGVPKPGACDMSIVICCQNPLKLKECFKSNGCHSVTNDMFPYLCSSDSINRVIQDLGRFYKSTQEK